MSYYKGVPVLKGLDEHYPRWRSLVLGHMRRSCESTYTVLCGSATDQFEAASLKAAKQDLLLFLDADFSASYESVESGLELWTRLQAAFARRQATWAPIYADDWSTLAIRDGEGVAVFCARALKLYNQMASVGQSNTWEALRTKVLHGMKHAAVAQPRWLTVIDNLRNQGACASEDDYQQLVTHLERNEVEFTRDATTGVFALAARTAAAEQTAFAAAVQQLTELAQRAPHTAPEPAAPTAAAFAALQKQLADLQASKRSGGGGGGRGRPRGCWKCGALDHVQRDCPGAGPPPGVCLRAAGSQPSGEWIFDSGCSQHMCPGGAHAFSNYRTLSGTRVRFGMAGAGAWAVGIGDLAVMGCAGLVTLTGVLHVPDLAGPLLSVSRMVADGCRVLFELAQDGQAHRAVVMRGSTAILSAGLFHGIYMLHAAHHANAAHAEHLVSQQAHLWHQRLGHISFGALADLVRHGHR